MDKKEKKAIEILKNINKFAEDNGTHFYSETIIKLIERLEKENNFLNKECEKQQECYCEYKHYKQFESTPNDKIREKIKELNENKPYLSKFDDWKEKEYTNEDVINNCIEVLEELLGEKE